MDLKLKIIFLLYLLFELGSVTVYCDNNVPSDPNLDENNKDSNFVLSLQNNIKVQNELILKLMNELLKKNSNSHVFENSFISNCASTYENGVQLVQLDKSSRPFEVLCDQETHGGGWTVVQHRYDGSVWFHNRTMDEFIQGFGNINGEFFMGLDKLSALTNSRKHEMLLITEDLQNDIHDFKYSLFQVHDKSFRYWAILTHYDDLQYGFDSRYFNIDSDWNSHSCNINGIFPIMEQNDTVQQGNVMTVYNKGYCKQIKFFKILIRPTNPFLSLAV